MAVFVHYLVPLVAFVKTVTHLDATAMSVTAAMALNAKG